MFEQLSSWIRGLWEKIMLSRETIKNVFNIDTPMSTEMSNAIDLWSRLYSNQAPWLNKDIVSLNLPVAISSEIARITTIECKVKIEGSARADWLNEQMDKVTDAIREQVEYGVALGGMIMKPYVNDNGEIVIDYVKADAFYPVEFGADGKLKGAIFVDKRQKGQFWYTKFEYHQMVGSNCLVKNVAFKSDSQNILGSQVPLNAIEDWAALIPEATIQNVDQPLFAYFRFPTANNIDRSSKLGVSCYARAVDLIEQADKQWSNFLWEFESGARALYVDVLAFGKDSAGNPVLPNKKLYRTIDAGGQEDALFKDWSPTFRQADILMGLDSILKRIEFSCGLAYGTLSDPTEVEKTATEILSAKQRTYAMVVDTQKALEDALEELVAVLDVWATLEKLAPAGKYETTFEFDDSIVVDKEAQFRKDLTLVNSGIMSKLEFRMRNFREPEDIARLAIGKAVAEQPALEFPSGM
jgi:A118 family predicted phage portal protein